MLFIDRTEAGKLLAQKLQEENLPSDTIILAIPNGGVVIGKQISFRLNIPLNILVTQNITANNLKGKTVILVDDGIVTGKTMMAAIRLVWQKEPHRVIIAIPVISPEALQRIEAEADEVIYLECPEVFIGLADFYQNFTQVNDNEVKDILNS